MNKKRTLPTHAPTRKDVYRSYDASSGVLSPDSTLRVERFKPVTPWRFILAGVLFLLLIALPVLLVSGAYYFYNRSDHLFPNINAGPVAIGGLTRAQAEAKVNAFWNLNHAITASDGQQVWSFTPDEIGLKVDPSATVEKAYQIGRGPGGPQEVYALIYGGERVIQPVIVFAPDVLRARLERLALELSRSPRNASIQMEGKTWVPIQGQNGQELDIEAVLQEVSTKPEASFLNGSLPLITRAISPEIPDTNPLMARVNETLAHPLKIRAYDPVTDETIEWAVPSQVFTRWVTVTSQDGEIDYELDSSYLAPYLADWKKKLEPERTLEPFTTPSQLTSIWLAGDPLNLLIRHQPTTYTVQAWETLNNIALKVGLPYWKIQQANPGIDFQALKPGQILAIPSKNEMIRLPLIPGKRIIIRLKDQRLRTYENGKMLKEYIASTGQSVTPTLPGVYQVQTHHTSVFASAWNLHLPDFLGIYEAWPGFMNGIHGTPPSEEGGSWWESMLGVPVTYGSIMLSTKDAESLYQWAEEGVVVEIRP